MAEDREGTGEMDEGQIRQSVQVGDEGAEIRKLDSKSGLIPTSLELRNFMSHKDTSIAFGDLTIIYSRENGAGKTSLLEGLMYAYTGSSLRGLDRDFKVSDVIRRGATRATVTLEGVERIPDEGGASLQSVYLRRRRSRSGPDLQLRMGGTPVGNAEEIMENITDARTFSRVTMINGHDVLTFLEGTPKERADILDRLFGIDVLESVRARLSTHSLEKRVAKISEQIANAERMRQLLENSGSARRRAEELEREIVELESKREELDARKERLIREEEAAGENLRRIREAKQEKKNLEGKLEDKRARLEQVRESLDAERARSAGVGDMLEDLRERFGGDEPSEIISQKEGRRRELVSKIQNEEAVPAVIDLAVSELRSGESESCPVCGSDCTVEGLRSQREVIVSIHEERKEHLELLTDELEELRSINERLGKMQVKRESIEDNIRRMQGEAGDLQAEIESLSGRARRVESADEDPDPYLEVVESARSSEVTGRIGEIEERIRELEIRKNSLRSDTEEAPDESEIPDVSDLEDKRDRLEALVDKFDRYRVALTEMRRDLRERMVEQVNAIVNDYLDTFQPEVLSEVEVDLAPKSYRGETQYRYEVVARDSYGRRLPFSGLSTGQKATALVSLVLSINDISANRVPVVLFDEIQASGLDEEGLKILIYMIVTLARVRNMVITSRSHDFVDDVREELCRTDEDGRRVHDIGVRVYELELAEEGEGVPLTRQRTYDLGDLGD